MAMYEVCQVRNGLVVFIFREDVIEDLAEKQEIPDGRKVWPHCDKYFSHFYDLFFYSDILIFSDGLLSLANVLDNHRIDG
jgi:hypothetical protein